MTLFRFATCFVLATLTSFSATASGLDLPANARNLSNRISALDSYALAVGPFDAGSVATRMFEGRVERQRWRLDGATSTTLQILAPLRDQITAAGYTIAYDCATLACGGFDFRFAIEVIPAPDMHVDIRDYRYLGAVRGENEALSILVSRMGTSAYIQVIQSFPQTSERLSITVQGHSDPQIAPRPPMGLAEELQAAGHVVLSDLVFETGAARLGEGPFVSLGKLAGFLEVNPNFRIALVGHTDSKGSLANNIILSKSRGEAVRTRMTENYGIAPERIEAEGMGYLAPVASNLTRVGRETNRRVEAILLSD
jgi:OOP family OmpA-OmpF porin